MKKVYEISTQHGNTYYLEGESIKEIRKIFPGCSIKESKFAPGEQPYTYLKPKT